MRQFALSWSMLLPLVAFVMIAKPQTATGQGVRVGPTVR